MNQGGTAGLLYPSLTDSIILSWAGFFISYEAKNAPQAENLMQLKDDITGTGGLICIQHWNT